MSFIIPVVLRPLGEAIVISVMWGFLLLTALSYFVARTQAIPSWRAIVEHVIIACLVVAVSYAIGHWIRDSFSTD